MHSESVEVRKSEEREYPMTVSGYWTGISDYNKKRKPAQRVGFQCVSNWNYFIPSLALTAGVTSVASVPI